MVNTINTNGDSDLVKELFQEITQFGEPAGNDDKKKGKKGEVVEGGKIVDEAQLGEQAALQAQVQNQANAVEQLNAQVGNGYSNPNSVVRGINRLNASQNKV